jgi:hypothetical protein
MSIGRAAYLEVGISRVNEADREVKYKMNVLRTLSAEDVKIVVPSGDLQGVNILDVHSEIANSPLSIFEIICDGEEEALLGRCFFGRRGRVNMYIIFIMCGGQEPWNVYSTRLHCLTGHVIHFWTRRL